MVAAPAAATQTPAPAIDHKSCGDHATEAGDPQPSASDGSSEDQGRAAADENEEEEEEVVAVGAVAHVVQRAFRSFFPSAFVKHAPHAVRNDLAPSEEGSTSDQGATSQEEVATPAVADSEADPTEEPAAEASETSTASRAGISDDDPPPPDPAQFPSNPFVQLGNERKRTIKAELRDERSSANRLLRFLEERHADAKRADEAVEEQLRRQGLVVKEQIPLGPSPLKLDEREVASPEFGAFSTHLLHAKSIVADYHKQRLERSGNAPSKTRERAPGAPAELSNGDSERRLGYLDSTHSAEIRTDTTLKLHERRIAGVKTFHATSSSSNTSTRQEGGDTVPSADETTSPGFSTRKETPLSQRPRASKQTGPEVMPATEKRANMAILNRMQTKLEFLRNPRYADDASSSTSGGGDDPHSFSVDPKPPITFTDYGIGGVYEQTLFVCNRTALSRRLRVLPPSTLFFSVAEVVFPDPSGLVAPGMHVQVRLRFAPDSRADYRDTLTIQYESTIGNGSSSSYRELAVPLAAHREPPELSIPLVLRAQNTLVGDKSRTEIPCANSGGAGTFWLMAEREWTRFEAEAAFRGFAGADSSTSDAGTSSAAAMAVAELTANDSSIDASGSFRSGPFRLSPTRLELDKGASTTLVLDYTPSSVGEQRERIVMVCDNCLVRVFQLVGRGCQVELTVTGANSTRIDRSIATMGALDKIFFPPNVLVDSSAKQTVTIANETPMDVKYSWRIAPATNSGTAPATSGQPLTDGPPFRVAPASGVFPQSSSLEFSLEFSPTRPLRNYSYIAALVVEDVPACSLPGPKQIALLAAAVENNKQCEADDDSSKRMRRCEPAIEALAFSLHGGATLGAFAIEPVVWDFSGSEGRGALLQMDNAHVAQVTLHNELASPVRFQWEPDAWQLRYKAPPSSPPPFTLAVSPNEGTLAPHSVQSITVEFTPHCVGPFSISIPCAIPSSRRSGQTNPAEDEGDDDHVFERSLLLVGDVARAQVCVLSPEVDFGLVLAGGSAEASIEIGNASPSASADWKFVHLVDASESRQPAKTLPHSASKESVTSRQSATTSVGNGTDRSGASSFATSRDTSPTATVAFAPESEVQSPNIFLSTTKLPLGTTYLGVSVRRTLELINISNLEASFKFVEPEATSGSKPYALELTPKTGTIQSKERLVIAVTYTARQAGRFSALVACNVRGLPAPLGFEVTSVHKGLVLSYELVEDPSTLPAPVSPLMASASSESVGSTTDTKESNGSAVLASMIPRLAFGDDVPLGERRSLYLLVRNLSGIDAVIDLEAKKFPVAVVDAAGDDSITKTLGSPSSSGNGSPSSRKAASREAADKNSKKRTSKADRTRNGAASSPSSSLIASTKSTTHQSMLLSNSHEHVHRLQSESGRAYTQKYAEALEDRRVLSHGLGIAFRLEPSSVRIAPWGQSVVRVVCFNNKTGSYVDEIVSRAAGLPPVMLPAIVTVTGAPLVLDRNCVGLFFPKQIARKAALIHSDTKKNAKKTVMPSSSASDYPTLRFGQVCVRSQGAVTRSLRIINRGPQPARVTWRLTPPGRENHLVTLTLRVDFGARVQLQITPCADRNSRRRSRQSGINAGEDDDDDDDDSPFTVSPKCAVISPFATVPFRVTLRPSNEVALHRLMLVADAKWLDDKRSSSNTGVELVEDDHHRHDDEDDEDGDGDKETATIDQRCELPRTLPSPDRSATRTAAGKAIAAVRMANTLTRHQPSWRVNGLGAVHATGNTTKSCVRVLLAADIIEPELFLDKNKHTPASEGLVPGRSAGGNASYHVTFTTWSTIVGSSASSYASAATHEFHRRDLQLVNHFQAPLTFRLECVGPFVVFRAESLAPKHPLSLADLPPAHRRAQGESFMFNLPPEMAVRLELRFDPSLMAAPLPFGQTSAAAQGSTHRQLRSLAEGELHVRFANHSVQTIRLGAWILQPMLVVTPATHSFGQVHIMQRRVVALRVTNPTVVPAKFTVEHVPLPVPLSRAQKQEFSHHHAQFTDEPSVFAFSIASGVVQGPTLSLKSAGGLLPSDTNSASGVHLPMSIEVSFRPKDAGKHYRSRFRLAVALGHSFEVVLQGVGHLDEYEVDDQERPMARVAALSHSHRIFTRL